MVAVVWQYCEAGLPMYYPSLKFGDKNVDSNVTNKTNFPGCC